MATAASRRIPPEIEYPSGDGFPMAETPLHRQNLTDQIAMLNAWFDDDPMTYVSGNMFVYYARGDRHKHVAPDVFVVRGVRKDKPRKTYRIWEEGKSLDAILELTSQSTREEDEEDKFILYRDVLKVAEYFLFDPYAEYLVPPLKGYRLIRRKYVAIEPVAGRLPSEVLGLYLDADGSMLRLYDPTVGRWLLTPTERAVEAETARKQAETARKQAETARKQAETAREQVEAENKRLRRELSALRRRLGG